MPDIFIDKDQPPVKQSEEITPPAKEEKEEASSSEEKSRSEMLAKFDLKDHKGSHFHVLSSYCEAPQEVKFTNALDEEILLLFLRRHFITNIPWILKAVALALIPVVFELLGSFGFIDINFVNSEGKFFAYSFYYFFILSGYVFISYISWFYNISIVTNIRIIDIDFNQLIFENVAATKLTQIEDVNYAQIGIIRSIFDYGDVFLQTAGTLSNFEFLAVPHPEKVIKVINNLIGKEPNA